MPWMPQTGDVSVYLQGTATQLQPGDAILIVGDERVENGNPATITGTCASSRPYQTDTTKKLDLRDLGRRAGRRMGCARAAAIRSFMPAPARGSLRLQRGQPADAFEGTLSNISGHIEALPNPPTVNSGGSTNYFVGDQVTVIDGGGANGVLQVQTTNPSPYGAVTGSLSVVNGGIGYSSKLGAATVGGNGTGLTVDSLPVRTCE